MKKNRLCKVISAMLLIAALTIPAFAAEKSYTVQPVKGSTTMYTMMIPKNEVAMLASYNSNGQFQGVKEIHKGKTGTTEERIYFELEGSNVSWKLFVVKADWTPIQALAKSEWSQIPFDPNSHELPMDS